MKSFYCFGFNTSDELFSQRFVYIEDLDSSSGSKKQEDADKKKGGEEESGDKTAGIVNTETLMIQEMNRVYDELAASGKVGTVVETSKGDIDKIGDNFLSTPLAKKDKGLTNKINQMKSDYKAQLEANRNTKYRNIANYFQQRKKAFLKHVTFEKSLGNFNSNINSDSIGKLVALVGYFDVFDNEFASLSGLAEFSKTGDTRVTDDFLNVTDLQDEGRKGLQDAAADVLNPISDKVKEMGKASTLLVDKINKEEKLTPKETKALQGYHASLISYGGQLSANSELFKGLVDDIEYAKLIKEITRFAAKIKEAAGKASIDLSEHAAQGGAPKTPEAEKVAKEEEEKVKITAPTKKPDDKDVEKTQKDKLPDWVKPSGSEWAKGWQEITKGDEKYYINLPEGEDEKPEYYKAKKVEGTEQPARAA